MSKLELVYRANVECTGEILEAPYTHEGFKSIYKAVLRRLKDVQHDKLYYDMQTCSIMSGMLIHKDEGKYTMEFIRADFICAIGVSVLDHVLRTYVDRI